MKSYTFSFKLRPQFLAASNTTVGVIQLNLGTGSGDAPITNATSNLVVNTPTSNINGFSDVALGCPIQLQDIASYVAYTSLFDAYKINSVSCRIEYLNNSSSVSSGGLMPTIMMYWDQDDAVPPVSLQAIQGKQGAKLFMPASNRTSATLKFRPLTRNGVNTAAAVSGAVVPNKSQWINCTSPNVPHYGFKAWISDFYAPGTAAVINAFRLHWTYNVSFRSPIAAS